MMIIGMPATGSWKGSMEKVPPNICGAGAFRFVLSDLKIKEGQEFAKEYTSLRLA